MELLDSQKLDLPIFPVLKGLRPVSPKLLLMSTFFVLYYLLSKDSLDISFTSRKTCETGTLGIRTDTLRRVNEVINTFFINLTLNLLFLAVDTW